MRDKARIRKFCEEFARLWEEKAPDMRFGQMIVCLNKAADMPRHDIFNMEENEMLKVIRRFFSREYRKSMQNKSELCDYLTHKWMHIMDMLKYEKKFDDFILQEFKEVFVDTWQYFIDTLDDFGIGKDDLPMICRIAEFTCLSGILQCIKNPQLYACMALANALLVGLEHPLYEQFSGNFYNGYLFVEEPDQFITEVHISNFESYFNELVAEFQNADKDYKGKIRY